MDQPSSSRALLPDASPRLAIRVDVDTLAGARDGVPRIAEMLARYGAGGSFFFTLGPDAPRGEAGPVLPASFVEAPPGGRRRPLIERLLRWRPIHAAAAATLRAVRDEGFEVGLRAWSTRRWLQRALVADADWTARELDRAMAAWRRIFAEGPAGHAAPGWQANIHALRLGQRLAFSYASHSRGTGPFVPVYNAELIGCPQLPTTLPTTDEIARAEGCSAETATHRLLEMTARHRRDAHVFTASAEIEGDTLAPLLDRLLAGWRRQGYELVALQTLAATLPVETLPRHALRLGSVPGRERPVLVQSEPFPGDALETGGRIEAATASCGN